MSENSDCGLVGGAGNIRRIEGGVRPPGGDYHRLTTQYRATSAPCCTGCGSGGETFTLDVATNSVHGTQTYSFEMIWYADKEDFEAQNGFPLFYDPTANGSMWVGYVEVLPGQYNYVTVQCVNCIWVILSSLNADPLFPVDEQFEPIYGTQPDGGGCSSAPTLGSSCTPIDGRVPLRNLVAFDSFSARNAYGSPEPGSPYYPGAWPLRIVTYTFPDNAGRCTGSADCSDVPVGEYWTKCIPFYPWCIVERRGYLADVEADFHAGPYTIARELCEQDRPPNWTGPTQAELEAAALEQAENECGCRPLWCIEWQDYDIDDEKVGDPYYGTSAYSEPDAAIGYVGDYEPIPRRRLAGIYPQAGLYEVVPESLKVPGKPVQRKFSITAGPWPRMEWTCRSCPECPTPQIYGDCICGGKPQFNEFVWALDGGPAPEGYDPSLAFSKALENWNDCMSDAAEDLAALPRPYHAVDFRLDNQPNTTPLLVTIDQYTGKGELLIPSPGWIWKLPVRFWIVSTGNPAEPLAVVKTHALGFAVHLFGPILGPAVSYGPGDTEESTRDDRLTAEDAMQAEIEASLDGYRDGPWWCVEYRERDAEGEFIGEPYQGCAEIRYAPGSSAAAASMGDTEIVPLGSEGAHYPDAVDRRRAILGGGYDIGAGENDPLSRCKRRCPSCGEGATEYPSQSLARTAPAPMMAFAASASAAASVPDSAPRPDARRMVALMHCGHRGERVAGQGCGGTLYECRLFGDLTNTVRPCARSQRCCQECPQNTGLRGSATVGG